MKNFSDLKQTLGITFDNQDLLKQAFTHRSYINENPDSGLSHNERLEYLGDAVLELSITQYLFHTYPNTPEGELTAYRAALVRTESISDVARKLNFDDYLLLSKGEAKDTWKDPKSLVQEKAQDIFSVTPSYIVLNQVGPDHDKLFTVGIAFGDDLVAEGTGHSKQDAEQKAARAAPIKMGWKK